MEWYISTSDLIYSGMCWTLIVTCVLCAVFRWFHLCHPFNHNPDYYYPARKFVCAFYLCQLLYLPFIIRPSEPHTILYTRCVELLLTTVFLPMILNRFFQSQKKTSNLYRYAFYICPLVAFAIVGLTTLFTSGNLFLTNPLIFLCITGFISCIMCMKLLHIMIWLWHKIDNYHKEEYSNEADFPYKFAQKVLFLPWIVIGFCWIIFFTGNRLMMAVLWAMFCILAAYYAVTILHPQRKNSSEIMDGMLKVEDEETETASQKTDKDNSADADKQIVHNNQAIRLRVIEIARHRYLEPHLMRRDIIAEFNYGERTEAGAVISSFGFYDMINTLRLEHARQYAKVHPNETKESIAINSGFKDRFAMRHAASKIGEGNPEILDGFTPKDL